MSRIEIFKIAGLLCTIAVPCFLVSIWSSDGRWAQTGLLFLVPGLLFALTAALTEHDEEVVETTRSREETTRSWEGRKS